MHIISASYGNDSIALIQWAYENKLEDVFVLYADTGWCHPDWAERVKTGMDFADSCGFTTWIVKGEFTFETIVKMRKGFPNQKYQWCSGLLKGIPLNEFQFFLDPKCTAKILIGKRRAESNNRKDTPEFVLSSEYHEGRTVWHPLYKHTDEMRDILAERAEFEILPHRSMECCPCINANRFDLRNTPEVQIERVRVLEKAVGNTMFKPSRTCGAVGIDQVLDWAWSSRGRYKAGQQMLFSPQECQSSFCGY